MTRLKRLATAIVVAWPAAVNPGYAADLRPETVAAFE